MKANRELWDKLAKIHHKTEFYDVEGFLKGKQTLDPIEIQELPDLSGKKLLHLMCHFGMDTLSLARRGADATGVDFSSEAIELAMDLSKTAEIDARFVCSNVYDLPGKLREHFDNLLAYSHLYLCYLAEQANLVFLKLAREKLAL